MLPATPALSCAGECAIHKSRIPRTQNSRSSVLETTTFPTRQALGSKSGPEQNPHSSQEITSPGGASSLASPDQDYPQSRRRSSPRLQDHSPQTSPGENS